MSGLKSIKLKKGLNIRISGLAQKMDATTVSSEKFCIKPPDFMGIFPKLLVKPGDVVKSGSPLFFNKYNEKIVFTSPISGKIIEILRGEKRVLQEIKIEADNKNETIDFGISEPNEQSKKEIVDKLLESGVWPFIRQKPFSRIANPDDDPKAIFISAFDSSPLAPDNDFIVHGKGELFQTGIDVLKKLTTGKVHININGASLPSKVFTNSKGVEINDFSGPHPAGNVGIQIHHINPINKGDIIWYINPQDILTIGRLFKKGIYDSTKIIAFTGPSVISPKYYKVRNGMCIDNVIKENVIEGRHRYISGNVLTGTQIPKDGYISFYDSQITVIKEGNHFDFLGWGLPGIDKYSTSRSFFSWLQPKKKFDFHTNLNGGVRAFVMSGEYEKVLPMDIYPVNLLKAIMIEDIEAMENLGIYEVSEEDMALCEFVCTSKINVQELIKKGHELMIKEMM